MPELPEVETVVRGLNAALKGMTIKAVPHIAAHLQRRDKKLASLAGDRFELFTRRGKYIIAELKSGRKLLIHLRMSGRVLLVDRKEQRQKHDHFVATFTSGSQKMMFRDVRKFGVIEFLQPDRDDGYGSLGVEATEISATTLAELALGSKRPIKALLLDQSALAGVGNIYADESLYLSGIHPLRQAKDLNGSEIRALASNVRRVLRAAVKKMGTTFDSYRGVNGNPGEYSRFLRVYNREGSPCRRCGGTIIKIKAAGRGTHLCPTCQPIETPGPRKRHK